MFSEREFAEYDYDDAVAHGGYTGSFEEYFAIPRTARTAAASYLRGLLPTALKRENRALLPKEQTEFKRILGVRPSTRGSRQVGFELDYDDVDSTRSSQRAPGAASANVILPPPKEGSAHRYRERIEKFKADGKALPQVRHYLFWLLHNLVAHPILGLVPTQVTVDFHEVTSKWLNHEEERILATPVPVIRDRLGWLYHNIVAHVAIGLLPCETTFDIHDTSAKDMDVPGWV